MLTLQFLGAAGTVTGSRFLLTVDNQKVLIDCGLFQGGKELKERNWNPFPVNPEEIQGVFVTHAHLDHTGYLPKLVELGFKGKTFATPSTVDLMEILLRDSAHLQEEEAAYHNRGKFCCPHARPLYTLQEAEQALYQTKAVPYGESFNFGNIKAEFIPSGHILGSAFIRLTVPQNGNEVSFLFTGDMGRYHSPILKDPFPVRKADYLLVESTYGDRIHEKITRIEAILPAVQECLALSGCLLIPAFTVGRTQEILYTLREMLDQKKIPQIPVYVDSPMAIDVTHLYAEYHQEHDMDMEKLEKEGHSPFRFPGLQYVRTTRESKSLNHLKGPLIIISANGMCTGGRIMHHLANRLPDPTTILLFVGYQGSGTRGRELLEGAKNITIFHEKIEVNARIKQADNFSAHGDYPEILQWISGFEKAPLKTFLVHGEPESTSALKGHIYEKFPEWKVEIAQDMQSVEL